MKIELKEPFRSKWKYGYLVENKEPRRNVILYNSDKDRTTVSYARYLMSCELGRFLDATEHVDHVNGDRMDDRIENYQILSPKENHNKSLRTGETLHDFVCPVCSKQFQLTSRQSHRLAPTCSRKCGGVKSHWS